MINRHVIIILFTLLLSYTTVMAQAEYPSFTAAYWENKEDLAQGKITRGTALGIAGLILIWPTAVMISRAKDTPHKYVPLSIIFGTASVGAMAHGFASISTGKDEKATAAYWVEKYTTEPDSTNLGEQQADYLFYEQESARKMTIFGVYAASTATILLTNGIIQSARNDEDLTADDIHIWPYYVAGGALLPMGILSIVRSRKRDADLTNLETETAASIASRSQFIPFVTVGPKGQAVFGAVYSRTF